VKLEEVCKRLMNMFNRPVDSLVEFIRWFAASLAHPMIQWYFVISTLAIAFFFFFKHYQKKHGRKHSSQQRKFSKNVPLEFLKYLFPKKIILHRSSRLDLLFVFTYPVASMLLRPVLIFGVAGIVFTLTLKGLTGLFGDLVSFGEFASNKFHKVNVLWQFHKVHHSAEVLTPLTDYRVHPLELMFYIHSKGIGLGLVQGVFAYLFTEAISVQTVLGLNAVFFFYYLFGYPLRHSHIWVSYGRVLSHVFISPAQHQIHHSVDKKHWDKNLGSMFALWDWMFGTLYVPASKEKLKFGLSGGDAGIFCGCRFVIRRGDACLLVVPFCPLILTPESQNQPCLRHLSRFPR